MDIATRTARRRVAPAAALIALLVLAFPAYTAGAKKRPPRIGPMPVAEFNKETGEVGFAATVFRARKVVIRLDDRRRRAAQVEGAGTDNVVIPFGWEATFSDADRQKCYRIEVVARNRKQSSSRTLKACRLGQPSRGTSNSGH